MDARVKPAHDTECEAPIMDATLIVIDSDAELVRAFKLIERLMPSTMRSTSSGWRRKHA